MPYQVTTPVFDGPLDLLLHLVTAEKVDLWEVSISRIVDAYLGELASHDDLDLEVATELALTAAILIELKCRRLLPGPDDAEGDEELSGWEERDLLLARLLECRTFREAARALEALAARASLCLPRVAGMEEPFARLGPDPLAGLAPEDLRAALLRVVDVQPPPRVDVSHLPPLTVSVGEAAAALVGELAKAGVATFRHLTRQATARMEVIVAFLAVLELYKDGLVDLDQAGTFGELRVSWLGEEAGAAAVTGAEAAEAAG